MPLPALEPLRDDLLSWAAKRSLPVTYGLPELSDAYPDITIVGFRPENLLTFCTLAEALERPILLVNLHLFDEENLRLAEGMVADLPDPTMRRHYAPTVATAKEHLGQLQGLDAFAFASDLSRAVVFRSTADWAAPFRDLFDDFQETRHPRASGRH